MRVTVCELPHETEALAAAWAALCEHTQRERVAARAAPGARDGRAGLGVRAFRRRSLDRDVEV